MQVHLFADFNIESLARHFANDAALNVSVASSGEFMGSLLTRAAADVAVIWTTPERVVPAFGEALAFEPVREDQVMSQVRQFANAAKLARASYRSVFVVSWTLPVYMHGYGISDLRRYGIRALLNRMNLILAEELEVSGLYVLDAQKWIEVVGRHAYSPKLWYLSKTPFHADVFKEAARQLRAAIAGLSGSSKKLLIVDLDDTLWGGILGDLGWENLRLGGHDYLGEAFVDFQKGLKALSNRGILLGIVSKNEEALALEAISKHPEMVLRSSNFAGWKINWRDKAENIVALTTELNLGLDSVVFIDDSSLERARVREALPAVLVPDWPLDKTLYPSALYQLDCFDSPYLTAEDGSRANMYLVQRARDEAKMRMTAEEWLRSLNTELLVEEMNERNRPRIVQLLNKANQMNLCTRRMDERELLGWSRDPKHKLWGFRVRDRFGDAGITGILSVACDSERAYVTDFVLSCRVMGRNVEQAMLAFAVRHCRELRIPELLARYTPTPKNKPCFEFWKTSGFLYDGTNNSFTWRLDQPYPFPAFLKISAQPTGAGKGFVTARDSAADKTLSSYPAQ